MLIEVVERKIGKPAWRYAIELLLLLAATLVFLHLTASSIGINVDDDSEYLRNSRLVELSWFLHNQQWGPLYDYWIKLLSVFCPQPLALYFFNWRTMVVLLAMLPPLLRVRMAWLYTLAIVTLPIVLINSYIALFASIFVALGLSWFLRRQRSWSTALVTCCVISFVIAFARPEFSYGTLLAAAGALVAILVEGLRLRPSGRARTALFAKAAVVLVLALAMRVVQSSAWEPNRSGMAFEQHFNLRAAENGLIPPGENSWYSTYAQRQFNVDTAHNPFSTTAPMTAFLKANPRLFFSHVRANLRDGRSLAMFAFFLVMTGWPWLFRSARSLRPASLMMIFFCLPSVVGILLVYPREHYPMTVAPALLLLLVQAFELHGPRRFTWPLLLATGLVLLGFAQLTRIRLAHEPFVGQRYIVAGMRCAVDVDAATGNATPDVYDALPEIETYVTHRRVNVPADQVATWPQFSAWASQVHPAWIAREYNMSERLHVPRAALDGFLEHDLGYTPHACARETGIVIYSSPAK
jgi:hypothetical protein